MNNTYKRNEDEGCLTEHFQLCHFHTGHSVTVDLHLKLEPVKMCSSVLVLTVLMRVKGNDARL